MANKTQAQNIDRLVRLAGETCVYRGRALRDDDADNHRALQRLWLAARRRFTSKNSQV